MIDAMFATDIGGGFGYENTMPWTKNKEDMNFFRKITHNTTIVMGKATANSMPLPLPYRVPVIVSSTEDDKYATINYKEHDVIDTLLDAQSHGVIDRAVLIGGLSILTLDNLKRCNNIYYTQFKNRYEATKYMDKDIINWVTNQENSEVLYEDFTIKIIKVINEQS